MNDLQSPVLSNRVVLLGASNLTLGLPTVVHNVQAGLDGSTHIEAVHGHGRSYGNWSKVLFRELPGIVGCNLWTQIQQTERPPEKVLALVTDVGNDLMYNAKVSSILEWVEGCLERLKALNSEIVMTLPPISTLRQLSAWRFTLMRSILFPRNSVRLPVLFEQASELHSRLIVLGEKYGVRFIEPPEEWYGFDPIHIRSRWRADAWRQILEGWPSYRHPEKPARPSLVTRCHLWSRRPAERRFFGRLQKASQPACRFGETKISFY